jgi:molybdopterin synthase catalytic subunit
MSFLNNQIHLSVRFFATLRDRVGKKQIELNLEAPATARQLLEELVRAYPSHEAALHSAVLAINEEFAFEQDPLHDGDEVALFPPVSGGSGQNNLREYFAVTEATLSFEDILANITGPETGGAAIFVGQVRGITHTQEDRVHTQHLFYEAYIPMAENKMRQIAQEIRDRFPPVHGIAIVQRVGKLEVGEITVLVACTAGHRDNGIFEAARYGIDRLKEIVPVWKKEVGPDNTAWVEGNYHPTPDDVNKQ